MPFVDSAELAGILGEAHATVQRILTDLLAEDIAARVSHGTTHLPSSRRHYLTARGIREVAQVLDINTPSDFVRAYPMSREWLTLLIRRMEQVVTRYGLGEGHASPNSQAGRRRRGCRVALRCLQPQRLQSS